MKYSPAEKRMANILKKTVISSLILCSLAACAPRIAIRILQPEIKLQVSKQQIEPGHVLRINAYSPDCQLTLIARAWGQTTRLILIGPEPICYEGFLAVPLETLPGPGAVTINAFSRQGQKIRTINMVMQVIPRSPYKTSRLNIRGFGKYDFAPESRQMATARQGAGISTGPRLTPFVWPVQGRISEIFGVKRIYNQGIKSWFHGGIDIAALGGTPIIAPAEGRVILVEPFTAHGNTVLIDHGYGVITTYLHLRKILVGNGEVVKRGGIIGEVGTTGSSTGNHLHFQINVNGIKIDPYDFLESLEKSN